MKQEEIDQLLTAVEERVTKAIEPVVKENDDLKGRLAEVEKQFTEEGELVKQLKKLGEEGDQALRKLIIGDDENPGLIKRLGDLEALITTRKSVVSQDDNVVIDKAAESNPLGDMLLKAIKNPGTPVKLAKGE